MPKLPVKIADDVVLDSLKPDIDKATAVQDELAIQREEYYKRFRGESYGNERSGWSQSVAPVIANNLNWSIPSLMEIFHEEYFTLRGMDQPVQPDPQTGQPGQSGDDRAHNFQKLIYYQMFRKQDGFRRAYDFLYDAYLYHYAIFKVCYREDFDIEYEVIDSITSDEMLQLIQQKDITISNNSEVTDDLGEVSYEKVKVARKKILYAGPKLEVIPPWEFYYSPDCKTGDWGSLDGRLVFHEVKRTMNDIRKREQAGIYRKGSYQKVLENFEEARKSSEKPDSYEVKIGSEEVSEIDTQAPESNELSKEVNIRECFYRLDIDGDGLLEPVIIDLCGDVILRLEENPYTRPPFRIGSIFPESHKVTGIAMPKTLENDQKVMTNLLRLIQDSAAQSCYRNPVTNDQNMFKMLQDRKPFAAILGQPDKLGEVKQAPPDQFILKAYDMMKQENEEKTGNTRYNQGTDAASLNKTATGISAIFNASEKRMRLIAALMGNGPFNGVIRDFIFINQKWPSEDPIRLLGTNIVINKEDLDGEYDIEVDIGTSPSERQSIANQIDLFIQFGTQAGLQMGIVTPEGMIRAIKKKYRVLGVNMVDCLMDEKTFLQNQAKAAQQPPPPDPEQEKMKMEMQLAQQKAQMDQQVMQQKLQMEQQQAQIEQQQAQADLQVEQQKAQMELQGDQAKLQMDQQESQMKMQMTQELHQQKMRHNEELHDQQMSHKAQEARIKESQPKKQQ